MGRREATTWVLSVCIGGLRRSQAKTLGVLVAAAMGAPRLTLAGLGRQVSGATCVKHKIKRAWRFIANPRVEPVEVMRAVVSRLVRRHVRKLKGRPLLISFDWTKVRSVHVLMAAIVIKGRAIPLCWGSYADKTLGKSQNALEEGLLLAVKAMLGSEVKVILLADRPRTSASGAPSWADSASAWASTMSSASRARRPCSSPATTSVCGWTNTRWPAEPANCTGTCSIASATR